PGSTSNSCSPNGWSSWWHRPCAGEKKAGEGARPRGRPDHLDAAGWRALLLRSRTDSAERPRDTARHRRRDDEPDRAPESRRQRDRRDLRLAVRAFQGSGRAPGGRPEPRLGRGVDVAATWLSILDNAPLYSYTVT